MKEPTNWSRGPNFRFSYDRKKHSRVPLGIHNETKDVEYVNPNPVAIPKNGTMFGWFSLLQMPSSRHVI